MSTSKSASAQEDARSMLGNDENKISHRQLAPGITTHPLIRSGRPCIARTGLRVTDIVKLKQYQQMGPAEIAKYYEIELSQVTDALNYYAANTQYIDTDIQLQISSHEQLAEAHYGSRRNTLLSRRKSVS